MIWEVAVKEGFGLNSRVTALALAGAAGSHANVTALALAGAAGSDGNTGSTRQSKVWRVCDEEKNQTFHISLDAQVSLKVVKELGLGADDLFVCRDAALTDTDAANLALQCRLKTI